MRPYLVAALTLTATGCRKIEEAPKQLDALLHYLWVEFDAGDPDVLAEGVRNLDAAIGAAKLEDSEDGTVSSLTPDEAALVGVTDRDPRDAKGVYLNKRFACDRPDLEAILVHADQAAIYTGVYDAYSRDFEGDPQQFLDGGVDELNWTLEYTASILGSTYVARSTARLIRLPDLGPEASPWGPVVIARTYMPHPATFETENKSMDQDYQLELYWERDPGEIVHVYGLWRQADFGSGFTSDDTAVQRILLNNLADWDDTTEETCATGIPAR